LDLPYLFTPILYYQNIRLIAIDLPVDTGAYVVKLNTPVVVPTKAAFVTVGNEEGMLKDILLAITLGAYKEA
jgi:hypothetical protein